MGCESNGYLHQLTLTRHVMMCPTSNKIGIHITHNIKVRGYQHNTLLRMKTGAIPSRTPTQRVLTYIVLLLCFSAHSTNIRSFDFQVNSRSLEVVLWDCVANNSTMFFGEILLDLCDTAFSDDSVWYRYVLAIVAPGSSRPRTLIR